ncbi:DNA helicase [Vandammella animalimorsus]|uniref:DNA 3'-5' helicase n=1 Tax=Vandammella animalimorsus TaxID=2029117 RepID=A0A2A2AP34_9BURK|nr:UvrD-helicase domain-containing protein [Vandammella animalimorsus]PAT39523.1 DNA helicase [Vandammella animalimorsus]
MHFRIADTFTASLARLTRDEQKLVKTTAFDLQMDPSGKGHSFHKLDRAKDPNFWSVRVSRDIRLIVHRMVSSLLLCYVDHHDKAYQWAERRKLQTHPATGAAQLVEIRESVQEVAPTRRADASTDASAGEGAVASEAIEQPASPATVAPAAAGPALFAAYSDDALLAYGVPLEWLDDVRAADEDGLLELVTHLPAEAGEALLELATGGTPTLPTPAAADADPFLHPDAQRRFRTLDNAEELAQALEYPWDKWTVFLHPAQRQMVARDYNGPARVSGSAGTGKTVVALHRAAHLARQDEDARVWLTTFSDPLAKVLQGALFRLLYNTPRVAERIDVASMDAMALRLYRGQFGKPPKLADEAQIAAWLQEAAATVDGLKQGQAFLLAEWQEVVDAWQLDRWEAYRDAKRLGRKTRLPEAQRALCWQVFEQVLDKLQQAGQMTRAGLFRQLSEAMAQRAHPVFSHIVVDEAQDIGVQQLRFLAALAGDRPNALFFAGDLGQRIFQQPFSWKSQGVDISGRSRMLTINYRTSHQIRAQADRLLGPEVSDLDGNVETRKGTVSVFNGPEPVIRSYPSAEAESRAVGQWLRQCVGQGVQPHEMAVFVRSQAEMPRAQAAVAAADLAAKVLEQHMASEEGCVSLATMHLAKGMEFRAVAVMACDDEVIPSQARINTAADEVALGEIYDTERHLLYVACTRARDFLHVSAVAPESEFLQDLVLRNNR